MRWGLRNGICSKLPEEDEDDKETIELGAELARVWLLDRRLGPDVFELDESNTLTAVESPIISKSDGMDESMEEDKDVEFTGDWEEEPI